MPWLGMEWYFCASAAADVAPSAAVLYVMDTHGPLCGQTYYKTRLGVWQPATRSVKSAKNFFVPT